MCVSRCGAQCMWQDQLVPRQVVVPKVWIFLCQSQKYMFGMTFHIGLLWTFAQRWKCTLNLKMHWKLLYLHLWPKWNGWQKLSVIWMVNSLLNFLQNHMVFLFTFLWNFYVDERLHCCGYTVEALKRQLKVSVLSDFIIFGQQNPSRAPSSKMPILNIFKCIWFYWWAKRNKNFWLHDGFIFLIQKQV